MNANQYLQTQKALLHTTSVRTGASYSHIAAFLIASARLFQHYAEYEHAQSCLEAAADLIAEEGLCRQ